MTFARTGASSAGPMLSTMTAGAAVAGASGPLSAVTVTMVSATPVATNSSRRGIATR